MLQAAAKKLPAVRVLKTLNQHQNLTVVTMAELIIPQTETPGAKAARVNEFIDLLLSDWFEDDDKANFLAGLADVDTRSQSLFNADFTACNEKQQIQILTALDEEAAHAPPEPPRPARNDVVKEHFFRTFKTLTLHGYYTSQIGSEQELHQHIIPLGVAGCATLEEAAE